MWKAGYDMPPDQFEAEVDRLWGQVKPLYTQLHCYARRRLNTMYGDKLVPKTGPIPAHLFGNMWSQDWSYLYPELEPYKGVAKIDVTPVLAKSYDPKKMVQMGEAFYTSLGMDPLPASFWERSMLQKPAGKSVVCHASAWDVTYANDLRIKMCINLNQEDLAVIHHELGHDYYFHYYYQLPIIYQGGANDGFHEAIGDVIQLSMTPAYLAQKGLLAKVVKSDKATINDQMRVALAKIAFLPFGLMVDKWRWDAFSGKVPADQYNQHWWDLKKEYQGMVPPIAPAAGDFDPGAKYHVASNVPYMRYFLAAVLEFQFYRSLCKKAGWTGPLNECSIYGSKEAGEAYKKMLALGASKPWQDALFELTGQRDMDATAILEYFAPLQKWLEEQNKGQQCGW
jgi:peptidyl-dipeptidase A